ncbi:MAG TPA: FoF1 ATP synthase subunit a [Candidatus Paceibacterota bacterium]|nr:FoF1 ATP synthase subunit a [Candidatus Paceibacterota bacterium]
MQNGISVALAPEQIATLWGIPITNTLLTSWIAVAILIIVAVIVRARLSYIPGRFQALLESLILYVQEFINDTLENSLWSRRVFPLLLTLFLFIATSNIIEFTPGIGSIGFFRADGSFTPLFRSVNTDLNVTLTLAIISVISIEVIGIMAVGFWRYAGKFFNFTSPLNFIVGLIEFVSELSRFVSFSFRLFGNIFAGEVLIAVATYFAPYIVPAPLMAFEMFVGFVQAAVFALLTLFFIKLAIMDPHAAH